VINASTAVTLSHPGPASVVDIARLFSAVSLMSVSIQFRRRRRGWRVGDQFVAAGSVGGGGARLVGCAGLSFAGLVERRGGHDVPT
jgi:hypothetical protein